MATPQEIMNVPEHGIADRLGEAFELEQEDAANVEEGAKASEEPEEPEPQPESGEPEEVEAEAEESEETAEEEEEAGPEETAEEDVEISSFEELAEALEVDPAELSEHLKVKIGEESVPLSEVIVRASQAPLPEQMAQMMAEQTQVVTNAEAERVKFYQEGQANITGAMHALITQAEAEGGFSDQELTRLKHEDPERWAIKAEERRQFSANIDAGVRAARENQAGNEARQADVFKQRCIQEGMKLIQAIPAWQVQEVAIREATEISKFIQSTYGFSEDEMGDMPDHRLALAFRDLFENTKTTKKAETIKKTLTKKKLQAKKSIVPTRPRRAKGDPSANARAAARKRQQTSARDPNRVTEHEDSTAELLEGQL